MRTAFYLVGKKISSNLFICSRISSSSLIVTAFSDRMTRRSPWAGRLVVLMLPFGGSAFCASMTRSSRGAVRTCCEAAADSDEAVQRREASASSSSSASPPPMPMPAPPQPSWNPFRTAVLRLKATEPRFLSGLNREKRRGVFFCAGCGAPLFSSEDKYESGSGWPAFTRPSSEGALDLKREWDGRVEVRCAKCGGHQGHVFPDGPSVLKGGTGERYCVNGLALSFVPQEEGGGAAGGADAAGQDKL